MPGTTFGKFVSEGKEGARNGKSNVFWEELWSNRHKIFRM